MKIKLSKNQWENIGKKTGWLGLKKEAASIISDIKVKTLLKIFNALPGQLNKTDRITTYSKELAFNDTIGDAYISISFNTDKNAMHVEKYYENEFAQNEHGEVKLIPVHWDHYQLTIETILNIINTWIGTTAVTPTRII